MTEAPLFATAHEQYLDAGWSGILALSAGTKGPPPTGFTGIEGTWPSRCDVAPFGGSGTTGAVATGLGRDAILIDIDARNADLARDRIGMFMETA